MLSLFGQAHGLVGEGIKMNKLNSINKVTIKPILYCPARCEFCIPRRDNYRRLRANSESQMRICDYEKLIVELATLGVQEICISGGEPTLYKHLDCLVRSISLSNIKVSLNTNGFNLLNRLSKLIDSGLNCVGLSLYSNKIDIQDQLKKLDGIGAKAISLIKQFNNLDKRDTTVMQVPWNYDISNEEYDGLFISNGPGDPKQCKETIKNLTAAINLDIPIFGICRSTKSRWGILFTSARQT